jgi:hypothetical protein
MADELFKICVDIVRAGNPKPARRKVLAPGSCLYCDTHRGESFFPLHDASERCESGKHAHCTCDTCF